MASMQVSDKGGEISASVEETNRIRASLGLQPLAEKKEDPAVAAHAARVAAQKEEDAQAGCSYSSQARHQLCAWQILRFWTAVAI
eukprot:1738772-Pleurochrysis_carterae.AAC.3